jgi:hypothetical protein
MKFPYNRVLEIKKKYQAGNIDREDAKEQLAYLLDLRDDSDFCEEATGKKPDEYFKPFSYGPLLRLSDVCNTLRLWARTFCTPLPTDDEHKRKERAEYYEHFSRVDLAISKSCLLDRLFFQDNETVRTEPCPEHKGRWSGCNWDSPGCACRNGSNVTGWLPSPEAEGYVDNPEPESFCDFCGLPPLKQGLWSSRVDGKHGHPECMDKDEERCKHGAVRKLCAHCYREVRDND